MNTKKTILILCDWFLPGYLAGGPIQSIATLTQHLANDINFKIITTDRDFRSGDAYSNVKVNEWTTFSGRQVFYVSPENMNPDFILKLIQKTEHDSIYLNSLFSKLFTVYPLKWKRKGEIDSVIILAPRGMLGEGALEIKPLKKKIFLLYAELLGLFKNVVWQSTSSQETSEIKKRISTKARIFEISNLPNASSEIFPIEKKEKELRLCFISRISEKKNLNFAIDVLKKIREIEVVFDVFGPIEEEYYWNTCRENAKQLSANISFNFKGSLKPMEIGKTIAHYHALFLPTKNENYGHIIVETFQHCRPVIISDQTPWTQLQKHNVGFDISLNAEDKFVDALTQLAGMNQSEFDKTCHSCVSFIHEKLNIADIKKQYLKLFAA